MYYKSSDSCTIIDRVTYPEKGYLVIKTDRNDHNEGRYSLNGECWYTLADLLDWSTVTYDATEQLYTFYFKHR